MSEGVAGDAPASRGDHLGSPRLDARVATSGHIRTSVAAVILNWNQASLTLECVASLRSEVDHIYVVDNHSDDADLYLLRDVRDGSVTLIRNYTNLGYAGGCNEGVSVAVDAGFDTILVMNNDAFPDPGSVRLLVARLDAAPSLAAVGPAVVRRPGRTVLHSVCQLDHRTARTNWPELGAPIEALGKEPRPTDYLSGEVMLIRSSVIKNLGMFDSRYFCYCEDVDWSLRALRSGWRLEVVPEAIFEHVVSASSAGRVGTYYRARNLPLLLRVACGRSRLVALLLSATTEIRRCAAFLRRRNLAAVRATLRGWLDGVWMRA